MSDTVEAAGGATAPGTPLPRRPVRGPWRALLIAAALCYLAVFLIVPFAVVFLQAFARGLAAYWAALVDPVALAAIRLTLTVALIAVPLNLVFGAHVERWPASNPAPLLD